jgi:hypothetical protein
MNASFSPVQAHSQIEWDVLIENIRSGKTILFLGSELFHDGDKRLDEQLFEAIGAANNANIQTIPMDFTISEVAAILCRIRGLSSFSNVILPNCLALWINWQG